MEIKRYVLIDLEHEKSKGLPVYVGSVHWDERVKILDGAVFVVATSDNIDTILHDKE